MQNFGLSDLRLVAPEARVLDDLALHHETRSSAYRVAVRAEDILERRQVHSTLLEAVADCVGIVGTTVRGRDVYTGQLVSARGMVAPVVQALSQGPVALVFGRETHGLNNEELDLAHWIVRIPTAATQPSLNLAQAVLLLCYELYVGWQAPPEPATDGLADAVALENMFDDLEGYMMQIGFSDDIRLPLAKRRFRRIFHKAALSPAEVQLVRGLLHQSRWYAKNGPR